VSADSETPTLTLFPEAIKADLAGEIRGMSSGQLLLNLSYLFGMAGAHDIANVLSECGRARGLEAFKIVKDTKGPLH
jgi:hypothetical protein